MYAAIAPLILLLLSGVWTYPAVLEEVVKWVLIRSSVVDCGSALPRGRSWMKSGAVVGLIFGLSEAILYSVNAWTTAQWGPMVMRLALTVPMHTVTAVIIAMGMKLDRRSSIVDRRWEYVGLLCAMILHATFNVLVR